MKAAMEKTTKPRRIWFVLEVIFLSIIIPCITFRICIMPIYYLCGLKNNFAAIWHMFFIARRFVIPFILAFICELLIIAIIWPRRIRTKRNKIIVPLLAILILLLVTFGGYFLPMQSPIACYMRGFERYIQKNIDVSAVREWVETIPPEIFEKYKGALVFGEVESADWLTSQAMIHNFESLSPSYLFLYRDADASRVVNIEWGGGMWHWGVLIGNENAPMEEIVNDRDYDLTREIQKGVYVYSD